MLFEAVKNLIKVEVEFPGLQNYTSKYVVLKSITHNYSLVDHQDLETDICGRCRKLRCFCYIQVITYTFNSIRRIPFQIKSYSMTPSYKTCS